MDQGDVRALGAVGQPRRAEGTPSPSPRTRLRLDRARPPSLLCTRSELLTAHTASLATLSLLKLFHDEGGPFGCISDGGDAVAATDEQIWFGRRAPEAGLCVASARSVQSAAHLLFPLGSRFVARFAIGGMRYRSTTNALLSLAGTMSSSWRIL